MNCPACGRTIDNRVISVTLETLADIHYEWMSDTGNFSIITEKIPFVTVKNGTAPPKEPITEPEAEQPR